jgi:hypothetical protein
LHGVEIKNFGKQGVLMPWVAAGVGGFNELINCHVHNGGSRADYDHGLYISVDDVLVDGCIIHDNSGWGIHKYDQGDRLTVRNSLVYNQPLQPCIGLVSNNGGHKVYNNLVIGPCGSGAGLATWYGPQNSDVFNNTLVNAGIYVYQIGPGITFENNLLSGAGFNIEQAGNLFNVRNNLASSYGGGASGQGALSNNLFGSQYSPAFVNTGAGDYRLQSNSAGIDSGKITATNVDKNGIARPQGTGYDIGAFEYTSSSSSTLPSPSNLVVSP